MSYAKQTWTDNVTPLSAARLNNIEAGILNADFVTCTSSTRPATGLFDGMRTYETDTKAYGFYDATAAKWVMFDTQWQSFVPTITLGATGASNDVGTAITIGNGTMLGRYFRAGRKIDLQCWFLIGSTTSYGGKNGYILADYPTGLRPASAAAFFSSGSLIGGPARLNGTPYAAGQCLNRYDATSANRRMWFISGTESVAAGGAGAGVNLTAAGHSINWTNTYETDFSS
jgi:hypothetical protein